MFFKNSGIENTSVSDVFIKDIHKITAYLTSMYMYYESKHVHVVFSSPVCIWPSLPAVLLPLYCYLLYCYPFTVTCCTVTPLLLPAVLLPLYCYLLYCYPFTVTCCTVTPLLLPAVLLPLYCYLLYCYPFTVTCCTVTSFTVTAGGDQSPNPLMSINV